MVTPEQIQKLTNALVQQFAPERIILFGSYAYGTPTPDSDVDLLVIFPPFTERRAAKSAQVRQAIHAGFPLDVLAYGSDTLKNRLEQEDFFLREITEKGRVLYESTHR